MSEQSAPQPIRPVGVRAPERPEPPRPARHPGGVPAAQGRHRGRAAGDRRPGADGRAAHGRPAGRRPLPARGGARRREDAGGPQLRHGGRGRLRADPVHAGPGALRHRRHPHLQGQPGDVRRRARPGLRQLRARRRDQPGAREGAGGDARADGREAGLDRWYDLPGAGAVHRHRHPEPGRVGGRLPAPGGPARPLPAQDRRALSPWQRGVRDPPPDECGPAQRERRARPADDPPAAAPGWRRLRAQPGRRVHRPARAGHPDARRVRHQRPRLGDPDRLQPAGHPRSGGGLAGAGPDPRARLRAAHRRPGRGQERDGSPHRAGLRRRRRQHLRRPGGGADRRHGAAAHAGLEQRSGPERSGPERSGPERPGSTARSTGTAAERPGPAAAAGPGDAHPPAAGPPTRAAGVPGSAAELSRSAAGLPGPQGQPGQPQGYPGQQPSPQYPPPPDYR